MTECPALNDVGGEDQCLRHITQIGSAELDPRAIALRFCCQLTVNLAVPQLPIASWSCTSPIRYPLSPLRP